jgi:predicted permease
MSNFLLLICCLFAGLLLRRSGRVPEGAHSTLNTVIVYLALPAVTLHTLHSFRFEGSQLWPVLMPWLLFGVGALTFWLIGRWLGLGRTSIGALTLVGGLGNTSFVGLPMIESLQGRDGLALGLLIDQLGSYLVLSTVGVFAAALYAAEKQGGLRATARKIATFPPFIALVVALLSRSVPLPADVDKVLMRMGDTLAPLALISVGLQLRIDAIREKAGLLSLGLGYKLLVCPALVVAILWLLDADIDMTTHVSVIEAAMPPMIGAGIVAAQANLDAPLVSTMTGIGIPLGLLTAFGWHWLFMHAVA